ncbi:MULTISPECIES: hypothetical protein [unclassified Nocardia]|uniref:hypothetical protein n=1 Tax=unclassified Nocardia TaxID=2637762 RepID=UPI001CE3DD82|nr:MULTISPECIES: hypothetical protein [unclassified Nocardia]
MRSTLIVTSVLGAMALAAAPVAGADPAQGTLKVQATTGSDQIPVSGLSVGVTTCAAGSVLATLTTGADGTAAHDFAPNCYQAEVTSVPSGCTLASMAYVQVDVRAGAPAVAPFQLHCA